MTEIITRVYFRLLFLIGLFDMYVAGINSHPVISFVGAAFACFAFYILSGKEFWEHD